MLEVNTSFLYETFRADTNVLTDSQPSFVIQNKHISSKIVNFNIGEYNCQNYRKKHRPDPMADPIIGQPLLLTKLSELVPSSLQYEECRISAMAGIRLHTMLQTNKSDTKLPLPPEFRRFHTRNLLQSYQLRLPFMPHSEDSFIHK